MKDFVPVKIKIRHQGAPIVGLGSVHRKSKTIVALEINLRSTFCIVSSYGSGSDCGPMIDIEATELSKNLKRRKDGYHEATTGWTEIEFPEYKKWLVWCAKICKDSLYVCLVK